MNVTTTKAAVTQRTNPLLSNAVLSAPRVPVMEPVEHILKIIEDRPLPCLRRFPPCSTSPGSRSLESSGTSVLESTYEASIDDTTARAIGMNR